MDLVERIIFKYINKNGIPEFESLPDFIINDVRSLIKRVVILIFLAGIFLISLVMYGLRVIDASVIIVLSIIVIAEIIFLFFKYLSLEHIYKLAKDLKIKIETIINDETINSEMKRFKLIQALVSFSNEISNNINARSLDIIYAILYKNSYEFKLLLSW